MDDGFLLHMKLRPNSRAEFRYDLEGAPDPFVSPNLPGIKIKPTGLLISLMPDKTGRWALSGIGVFGHPYLKTKTGERLGKLTETIPFMIGEEGITPDDGVPEWLAEIAEHHVGLMNPEVLKDRQREAAREVVAEMLGGLFSGDLNTEFVNEVADKTLAAVLRVG